MQASSKDRCEGDNQHDYAPPLMNQIRLTAKIAVSITLLATFVLLFSLFLLLKDQPEDNYLQIIQSLTRSQDQLGMAMLIGGALIVMMTGFITWAITLYSSARIAGPLYRFSKNIELEIQQGPVATVKLRKDDSFQELSNKLAVAVDRLDQYYSEQLQNVDKFYRSLDSSDGISTQQYKEHVNKLKNRVNDKQP